MMIIFNKKTQEEIDNLIEIGKKYTEGVISESLLIDVIQSLRKDPQKIADTKKYLETQASKLEEKLMVLKGKRPRSWTK